MNVVCTSASLALGGAEKALSFIANYLCDQGHDVCFITQTSAETDRFSLDHRIERRCLNLAEDSRSFVSGIAQNLKRIRAMNRALRDRNPDVVLSFGDKQNVLALCASSSLSIPVVVSERTDPRHHRIGRIWNALRKFSYRKAAFVVVQTRTVANWASRIVSPSQIRIIPNCVEPSPDCSDIREQAVVGMGRFSEEKGFDLLIDGFAQIAGRFPNWRLEIYGEGPLEASLRERAGRTHARIVFPGVAFQPKRVFESRAVFALPSRYEGFPNALLEAMAGGCAVVAADCPSGPREMIQHGTDGLLIEPNSSCALAQGLFELLDDPTLRAAFGESSRVTAARFDPHTIHRKWERTLKEAVDQR
jgi:glycosyltransferase involved in cell wall biosynthesis